MAVEWSKILDGLKRLKDVGENNNLPEVGETVMELQGLVIELQEHFIGLLGEMERLKAESDLTGMLSAIGPYVFLEGDPEPHCRKCYDEGKKLIHMGKRQRLGLGGKPGRMCPNCKGFFRE